MRGPEGLNWFSTLNDHGAQFGGVY